MQPFVKAMPSLEHLIAERRHFIETGQTAGNTDPQIAVSWQRTAPRLNPHRRPQWKKLSPPMFERTLDQHILLHSVARPIMEDVHQFTERADATIILLDSTLCVLDILGKSTMLHHVNALGIEPGVFMTESRVGTNAFAIAQLEAVPTWVYGPEHYLDAFQEVSSVAAPIFNLEGGLIGVVGLLELVEACSVQSLGVAMVTAKAIEGQIQADLIRRDAHAKATQLSHILNSIDEGVLAWDARGIVCHLNARAGTLLGLRTSQVIGRPIAEFIALPKVIAQAAALGEDREDIEARFIVNGSSRDCIVNYHTIRTPENTLHLTMLRPVEQVRQLVTRQVGAMAHQTVDDLLGKSDAIRRIKRKVQAAANAHACALILGEAGTGKGTVVRAIHNSSPRARGPFIALNCRAIPRELVLPEFLGYEPAAYNGDHQRGQPSKFELVNGGTLYLDEIEALPLDMQAALLRVIEMRSVMRLGGKQAVPVDVRVIASSAADLEARAREGAFRSDLLFRLQSFLIQTVPLRERKDDIAIITTNILNQLGQQMRQTFTITDNAQQMLLDYPWPGNIRELESVLERAVFVTERTLIDVSDLPEAVRELRTLVAPQQAGRVYSLAEAEQMAIVRAGRAAEGNLTRTAEILGIGRSTLWRKMKSFGLSSDTFKN